MTAVFSLVRCAKCELPYVSEKLIFKNENKRQPFAGATVYPSQSPNCGLNNRKNQRIKDSTATPGTALGVV